MRLINFAVILQQKFLLKPNNMKKGILSAIMILLSAVMAFSQNITVNGTVYSRIDDEPLIGATVMCQITQQGTATDIDGSFQLTVPEGATIKVSYVGY